MNTYDERTSTKRPLEAEHAQELLDHLAKKTKLVHHTHAISDNQLVLFRPREDTIHCLEFFLGRLVEILDGYGMTPFIVGAGGTGQTVAAMKFAEIFPPKKVGNIMDCEEQFVDQCDKFLVIENDITKKIKISSARFNSWVMKISN
jgi:hypothetical protein